MINPALEFKRELEIFRNEGDAAVQFFYAWQTVNAVSKSNKAVFRTLNKTPLFWNSTLGAYQSATLVTLGRVFDPQPENHSVTRLLSIAHSNLNIFSKESLANRKRELSPNTDEWLDEYLRDTYTPNRDDFRKLKRHVADRRRIYEKNYAPLRHRVFAHKSAADSANTHALFANTNIRELQLMLVFLRRLHEALWQLFFNGHKPTLRPARYSVNRMLDQPSIAPGQSELQERITLETKALLQSIV